MLERGVFAIVFTIFCQSNLAHLSFDIFQVAAERSHSFELNKGHSLFPVLLNTKLLSHHHHVRRDSSDSSNNKLTTNNHNLLGIVKEREES